MFLKQLYQRSDYQRIVSCLLIFITILLYSLLNVDEPFYWDSDEYWDLGLRFVEAGHFSLLHYADPVRGYLFPLINFNISFISELLKQDYLLIFRIVNVLFFTALIGVLIPGFFQYLFNKRITLVQQLLFAFLIIFFWRGYFLYPLSDFWSLGFLFAGLICLARLIDGKAHSLLWALVLGVSLGGATLIRPSYQVVVLPVLIFAIAALKHRGSRTMLHHVMVVLLGILLIYIPQLYINYFNFQAFSPFLQTHRNFPDGLFLQQLKWGINYQKYETQVGNAFAPTRVFYHDSLGEGLHASFGNVWEYALIVLTHPLQFASIYFRHLFNGMDLVYPTPYIKDIDDRNLLIAGLNYSLWLMAGVYIWHKKRMILRDKTILFFAILFLLPVLLSLPGAVEVRFFLPLYILCYSVVCFSGCLGYYKANYKKYLLSRKIFFVPVYFAACFGLSFAVSWTIMG